MTDTRVQSMPGDEVWLVGERRSGGEHNNLPVIRQALLDRLARPPPTHCPTAPLSQTVAERYRAKSAKAVLSMNGKTERTSKAKRHRLQIHSSANIKRILMPLRSYVGIGGDARKIRLYGSPRRRKAGSIFCLSFHNHKG